jgi:hypothetical protein
MIIKVSTNYPDLDIKCQTPGRTGIWGGCRFVINEPVERCDWWVVASGLSEPDTTICDSDHTVFIANEPPGIIYSDEFLSQFTTIITCDRTVRHPGAIYSYYGLPWWVGVPMKTVNGQHSFGPCKLDYDALKAISIPNKERVISVVYSQKRMFPGHEKRFILIDALKKRLGDKLEIYGEGSKSVEYKWEAIAPYKYHLAIENSICPDYWTEKLSDAFLGWSLPLYAGCPNIYDYFPADSMVILDVDNPKEAAIKAESMILNDIYQARVNAISEARNLIIDHYNFFERVLTICRNPGISFRRKTLWPSSHFGRSRVMRSIESVRHKIKL